MLSPWSDVGARARRAWLVRSFLVMSMASGGSVAATTCPQSVTFVSAVHGTTVDLGWTGVGHGLELGSLGFTVGLGSCALREDGSCGACPITGVANVGRRCSEDTPRTCRGDADCNDAGTCRVFPRPPIACDCRGCGALSDAIAHDRSAWKRGRERRKGGCGPAAHHSGVRRNNRNTLSPVHRRPRRNRRDTGRYL